MNAGEVRSDIAAGDFTEADLNELLPFDNALVELPFTGEQIAQVLEQSLLYLIGSNKTGAYFPTPLTYDMTLISLRTIQTDLPTSRSILV